MKEIVFLLTLITQDGSEQLDRTAVYKTNELCHDWGLAYVEDFHFTRFYCSPVAVSSTAVPEGGEYERRLKENLDQE